MGMTPAERHRQLAEIDAALGFQPDTELVESRSRSERLQPRIGCALCRGDTVWIEELRCSCYPAAVRANLVAGPAERRPDRGPAARAAELAEMDAILAARHQSRRGALRTRVLWLDGVPR